MSNTINCNFGEAPEDNGMLAALGGYMPQLFGNANLHGLYTSIAKEQGEEAQPTNQSIGGNYFFTQAVPRPVDICTVRSLKDISPHHASCIASKKNSMIGLGFVSEGDDVEAGRSDTATSTAEAEERIVSLLTGESFVESKVDKVLDPFTLMGFAHELYRAVEDFLDAGTGYLEVVRDRGGFIIGINWMPYEDIQVAIYKDDQGKGRVTYKCKSSLGGIIGGGDRICSMFGKANRQWVYDTFYSSSVVQIEQVSEIIAFQAPSNMSRWYGYPDWLSASSFITLLALSLQYKSDFYTNRGVLAYILSVIGKVDSCEWKKIQALVQGSVGGGNNFSNLALQFDSPETKIQVDKLASSDKTELQFAKDTEVYATNIVSAHRVPSVIANILIPGKLGASNETVQAMIMFQLLNIGPKQNIIQQTLSRTLGREEKDGGIKELEPEDFRLRKITSQFDIQGLDTVGRMREEAATATEEDGSKRDVSDGVKD